MFAVSAPLNDEALVALLTDAGFAEAARTWRDRIGMAGRTIYGLPLGERA